MSGAKKMVLRIQSAEGTQRVEVLDTDVTSQLYERIYEVFKLNNFGFTVYKDKNRKEEVLSSKSRQIKEYKLQHGDMLYMVAVNGAVLFDQPGTSAQMDDKTYNESVTYDSLLTPAVPRPTNVVEDPVDTQLYKEDGKVQRNRDDKFCRHGANGRCVHCSPLEPFDEAYLKEQNIKHMSFHAYIRKMISGVDRGKFLALEDISCKIKPGCTDHLPWPRGFCFKCQPSAVTLNRQTYRHTDNVMLENKAIVERFLSYWRITTHQRIGILYGQYERHTDIPLGIRARVAAIYEPPQMSSRDSVQLLGEGGGGAEAVDAIASRLGLTKVGWIFTDLLSEDIAKGTVQNIRGVDSHFLSAQECIMAGYFQNQHPNACRYASGGTFGSKFVTVCVTGDSSNQVHMAGYQVSEQCMALVRNGCLLPTKDAPDLGYIRDSSNQVHMEGYQVSGQCMALVRDGCLLPTKDAPDLGYIRESSDVQYVPDVYYKEIDAYGNEVQRSARRLPVAYLLVDVPAGLGRGQHTFSMAATFPPANRPISGHLQTLRALQEHMRQCDNFLESMSDLHVLAYLATNDALPLSLETLEPLLAAVREQDLIAAERWRQETESWATLEQLMEVDSDDRADRDMDSDSLEGMPGVAGGAAGAEGGGGGVWTCTRCTFDNPQHRTACEMCTAERQRNVT